MRSGVLSGASATQSTTNVTKIVKATKITKLASSTRTTRLVTTTRWNGSPALRAAGIVRARARKRQPRSQGRLRLLPPPTRTPAEGRRDPCRLSQQYPVFFVAFVSFVAQIFASLVDFVVTRHRAPARSHRSTRYRPT